MQAQAPRSARRSPSPAEPMSRTPREPGKQLGQHFFPPSVLLAKSLAAGTELPPDTRGPCTRIPRPCGQTGKDCVQPWNGGGEEAGEKLCVHPGESAAACRKAAVNTFFFSFFLLGAAVLKEEPLRDAWLERLRWVGGEALLFWPDPPPSHKSPCRRTLCTTRACLRSGSPCQDPAPRALSRCHRASFSRTFCVTSPTAEHLGCGAEPKGGREQPQPPRARSSPGPGLQGSAQTSSNRV